MIPFPIINFGGGVPLPVGVTIKYAVSTSTGNIFILLTNGHLYVTGSNYLNGLGKTGTTNNATSGWTLTNTGVEEVYEAGTDSTLYGGVWVKKNNNHYEYISAVIFPTVDTTLQNSWNVLPESAYIVDGVNILSSAIQISRSYAIQPDGTVYRLLPDGPQIAWAEKTKYLYFANYNAIRVEVDGTLKYRGDNGVDQVAGTSAGTTLSTWTTIGDPSVRYVRAKCARGQVANTAGGSGAQSIVLIVAQREDGSWDAVGSAARAGINSTNVLGPNLAPMASIPAGVEVYLTNQISYTNASVSTRAALQVFISDRVNGVYQSTGGQGGYTYSLFRDLPITTNATSFESIHQDIIDDGGILHMTGSLADTFKVIVSGNGNLYWTGRGYTGAMYPADFTASNTIAQKFNLEGIVIPA